MIQGKIRAATEDGPKESCVSTAQADSRKSRKEQSRTIPPLPDPETGISVSDWKKSLVDAGLFKAVEVVDGDDLGPISAIGSPRVCVGFGECWTMVWIERLPWGWADPYKLFLTPKSKAAVRYALRLAEQIRDTAEREHAFRERNRKNGGVQ